jgi:multiple sugar transport system substrate-binding protein
VLDVATSVREGRDARTVPLLEPVQAQHVQSGHRGSAFGLSDNYVPDPGCCLKSVWTESGCRTDPAKWEDLVTGRPRSRSQHPEIQIPIGIGMSQELDSNMVARAMPVSVRRLDPGRARDVVLKSTERSKRSSSARACSEAGMNPAVLSWNAASNNQALNARQTAYILNSISGLPRGAGQPAPVADDISSPAHWPDRAGRAGPAST